ncbi:MAG: integrase [Elusimicrobia bacterium RIFCSPLOWO2_12_FULL_59_9]|nr:MAG: integrase [Elusimicrobia bacterium RIFCSPLOWO2_12_FULL_59_9]
MKLARLADEYIRFKRSLGMRFSTEPVVLKCFCQAMGDIDVGEVSPSQMLAFLNGKGPITTFWHQKFVMLKGLYGFAVARGYATSAPLPTVLPKRPSGLVPYIYTVDELRRILQATPSLSSRLNPLRPAIMRALLLLLYGSGLRIGEALALTLADVDLSAGLLHIRDSKFFKSRLVPIGSRLVAELEGYARKRRQVLPCPGGVDSAFFATRKGTAMSVRQADVVFRRLRGWADVHREPQARYQPRIHDIRHTFAVHRMTSWYRQGADVQRLLPRLSTYLGHDNIVFTQRYLTMTLELLQEANHRFERYAFPEVSHV